MRNQYKTKACGLSAFNPKINYNIAVTFLIKLLITLRFFSILSQTKKEAKTVSYLDD